MEFGFCIGHIEKPCSNETCNDREVVSLRGRPPVAFVGESARLDVGARRNSPRRISGHYADVGCSKAVGFRGAMAGFAVVAIGGVEQGAQAPEGCGELSTRGFGFGGGALKPAAPVRPAGPDMPGLR